MPAPHASQQPALRGRGWVAGLLLLVGANAVAAGWGFVGRPDGSALGIPQEWLEGTPFADYAVPGAILFLVGLLCLAAAVLELRRHRLAWFWAGMSGGALVVWIAVQAALMGSFRHPVQTILQAAVLATGVAVGLLALRQCIDWRRARAREGGA